MRTVLVVALGGAVGTALRYGLVVAFPTPLGALSYVTFFENVTGAFLLGVLLEASERWERLGVLLPLLGTGLLGSFTTFSALSLDLVRLEPLTALLYGGSSLLLGLLAASLGVQVARQLFRARG